MTMEGVGGQERTTKRTKRGRGTQKVGRRTEFVDVQS